VINVEGWAEICRLHRAEGRAIARRLALGRNTVRRVLASDGPPKYERPAKDSIVDAVERQIRELLTAVAGAADRRRPTVFRRPKRMSVAGDA
jgi:transposase